MSVSEPTSGLSFGDSSTQPPSMPLHSSSPQIRLLWLKPADSTYDLIECEVHVRDFDSSKYVACEELFDGPPGKDHFLLCDGNLCAVTPTVYEVLCQLRRNGWQWIWLPSFCSEQNYTEGEFQDHFLSQSKIFRKAAHKIFAGYQYSPLAHENCTRLLELEPAQSFNDVLQVRFRDLPLESALDQCQYHYLAIRKELADDCWPDSGIIRCNQRVLPITIHLDRVLRSIRAQGIYTLWVEALCVHNINELNVEQRTLLNQRMRSHAFEVINIRPSIFNYEPLASQPPYLRLLRIRPAKSTEDPLVVDIQSFPLDSPPDYTALSYTWGAPSSRGMIFTSYGDVFPVSANLFNALHHLRQHRYSVVWADAICINQNDNDERNQQVILMREIYRRAKKVVIDLGVDCNNQEHRKCRAYPQALVKMLALTSRVLGAVRPQQPQLTPLELTKFGIPQEQHLAWDAWKKMRARPWFTRSWIVQEAVAGPSSQVDVIYDRQFYRWQDLVDADLGCISENVSLTQYVGRITLANMGQMNSNRKSSMPWTLLDLVSTFRNMGSTDPRDKIYAFLGLASDQDRVPKPNYSDSVEKVYTDFAAYFVAHGQGMQLLCDAGLARSDSKLDLPSWVVDWSFNTDWCTMNYNKGASQVPLNRVYKRCRYPRSRVKTSQDPNVLSVSGTFIDRIQSVTVGVTRSLSTDIIKTIESSRHLLNEARKLLANSSPIKDIYPTNSELALYTTMIGDEVVHNPDHHVRNSKVFNQQADPNLDYQASKGPESTLSDSNIKTTRDFDNAIEDNLGNRRFCLTRSGYMGLVPIQSKTNDLIVLFEGARAPFVLRTMKREPQKTHLLIGDAYIHGIMKDAEIEALSPCFKEILLQ